MLRLSGVRTDPAPDAADGGNPRRELEQRMAGAEFAAYLADLRNRAKVEKNPKVFE